VNWKGKFAVPTLAILVGMAADRKSNKDNSHRDALLEIDFFGIFIFEFSN
jgi:hypothetical protein